MQSSVFNTVAALLVLASTNALSRGSQGHVVIANLAEAQLTEKASVAARQLLALEPGETLASISTWADEHRSPSTAAWHYINFPKGSCAYETQRNCPDDQCVVAAIDKQVSVLASSASDEKRLLALKYVVHLVGDIHQPLHSGYAEDRGGNSYQLQVFMRGSNLHSLWDIGLIRNTGEDATTMSKRLITQSPRVLQSFNAIQVAQESCAIVAKPELYPERTVGLGYFACNGASAASCGGQVDVIVEPNISIKRTKTRSIH